jgi:ATP-binding cassette subfamily F protein uup
MKDLLVSRELAGTALGKLSGGERGGLMLAQGLAKDSNLLVLDEPTNDLDMETLDVLEGMLVDYPGTALLISHDRDFLDRLVNGVVVPEGDGYWMEYAGGYSDVLAQRGADLTRAPASAEKPEKLRKYSVSKASNKKQKLSFKDQHALEKLPEAIAKMQDRARSLQARLDDPHFYARDRAGFAQVTTELGALQQQIAAAEEQWLALEILREESAASP